MNDLGIFCVVVAAALAIKWYWPQQQRVGMKVVQGKSFYNETVPLDGIEYRDCVFEDVTFVFEARAGTRFTNDQLKGDIKFQSYNLSAKAAMQLVTLLINGSKDNFPSPPKFGVVP
jgi:hypothetical protein